jgi:hypothetical protein
METVVFGYRELESLHGDIDAAISRGGLERFINSTEDASSLATHNFRLDHIISQLTVSRVSRDRCLEAYTKEVGCNHLNEPLCR